jgi:hypothetical protein
MQAKLAIDRPGDICEREADRVAEEVTRMPSPQLASLQAKPVQAAGPEQPAAPPMVHQALRSSGAPLDPATRAFMEPRFGHDFSRVRVHSGAAAEQSSREVNAQAYTVGRDIVFGAGAFAPGTHEGRRLMAHELTHVVQQSGAGGIRSGRIARKTLADLPEATRKALKISRDAPAPSVLDKWIGNVLDPKSDGPSRSEIPFEFGPQVTDADQKKVLPSIAAELEAMSIASATEGNTDPENWPLPANSILDLALDLRSHGGEYAIFRFTRYTEGKNEKVLIEKTQVLAAATSAGAAQAPAGQSQPPAGGAASFTGTVSVGNVKVMIDTGFSNDRGKAIADAVELLPDPVRANIDGITISPGGAGHGAGGRNGEYNGEDDTVRLWDDVFTESARREGAATDTAYQIVHELGHAVDLRPRFKAQIARKKASDAKAALERQLRTPIKVDPNAPLSREGETDTANQAEEQRLRAEIARLAAEIQAQSQPPGNSVAGSELGEDSEKLLTDFGKALQADGVRVVTDARKRNVDVDTANKLVAQQNAAHPDARQRPMKPHENTLTTGVSNFAASNLLEAFAENFAAYMLDDALLKAIRPKTYDYFKTAFPKTVRARR